VFTDKAIKALRPRAKPYRAREGGSDRGFGVQVTPARVKAFFLAYKLNGARRFFKLGRCPDTTLRTAREGARGARELVEQGIDPQEHAEARRQAQEREKALAERAGSVEQLFGAYVAHLRARGRRSADDVKRALGREAAPVR